MSNRIRWEPTSYGGITGRIGTLDDSQNWLVQIWRPGPGEPWQLEHCMPGLARKPITGANQAMLKVIAEAWLREFVAALGAIFRDDEHGGGPS